ncbi:MAG: ferrous iron transport protein A [Desulfohalobiaceae bacterium]|nr:ferrous iron transport protein A [Desulfohalobiaceae bacterium]
MASQTISLRKLMVKQKAKIVSLKASGELGRRIRDMGLLPGVEIQVLGRAPLQDPVALRVYDFTLTLRNNEADRILVQPLPD